MLPRTVLPQSVVEAGGEKLPATRLYVQPKSGRVEQA